MSFALDMSKFVGKANKNVDLVVRKIVLDMATEIVKASPVGNPYEWDVKFIEAAVLLEWIPESGYVGGRFKGNWDYGFNAAPTKKYDTIDDTGNASIGRIKDGMAGMPVAAVHYLANNLPYAQRLENGYSDQAPSGMLGLAVLKYQTIVDNAARGMA